jgi:hypothetical protein
MMPGPTDQLSFLPCSACGAVRCDPEVSAELEDQLSGGDRAAARLYQPREIEPHFHDPPRLCRDP